jgi:dGTPase
MLVCFGSTVAADHLELKQFLRKNLYRHYRVLRMTTKAHKVVQSLFTALMDKPELMPPEHWDHALKLQGDGGDAGRARAVADYIAGMTDRFAILEYDRLFDPSERT